MKNHFLALSIFSGVMLAGCSVGYVTTPPQDVTYVRPVSPGPDYVWIGGDWVWTGGGYHWREGFWRHPRDGYSWQSGHWENGGRGYRWHKGGWHR